MNSGGANSDGMNIEGGVSTKGVNRGFVIIGMAFVNVDCSIVTIATHAPALHKVVMQMERKEKMHQLCFCQNGDV